MFFPKYILPKQVKTKTRKIQKTLLQSIKISTMKAIFCFDYPNEYLFDIKVNLLNREKITYSNFIDAVTKILKDRGKTCL